MTVNLEDVAGKDFNVLPMQILASNCSGLHRWEPNLGLNASGDGHLLPARNQTSPGKLPEVALKNKKTKKYR